jgi:hypothetical protein
LATYLSACCDYPNLVAGETGICLLIASDTEQAGIALERIEAKFRVSPILRQLIKARTAKQLRLSNGICIQVRASDFRRVRGPTLIAAICDEACFFSSRKSRYCDLRGTSSGACNHERAANTYLKSLREKRGSVSPIQIALRPSWRSFDTRGEGTVTRHEPVPRRTRRPARHAK